MSKDNTLAGEGVRICALDTFVAIMAGLIIFPACFSYGVEVGAYPFDLRHTAKCICKYGRRKNLGNTVLPVHDICQLLNGYRCI